MTSSKLYVVATPLGHRDDITNRAKDLLKTTRVIFAEDTREIRKLLEMLGIPATGKTIHSYAAHNMKEATDVAITYLQEGFDIVLVSDRGTPALSDPGSVLVKAARALGFIALPVPGPSAVAALWSVAGLSEREFSFIGFFPEETKEKKILHDVIVNWNRPTLFFESPHRIRKTLTELKLLYPAGKVLLGREMTKSYEEYHWRDLSSLDIESVSERGEYTVCLVPNAGLQKKAEPIDYWLDLRLASDKEWAKRVGQEMSLPSKDIYNALQERKRRNEL